VRERVEPVITRNAFSFTLTLLTEFVERKPPLAMCWAPIRRTVVALAEHFELLVPRIDALRWAGVLDGEAVLLVDLDVIRVDHVDTEGAADAVHHRLE
jgi:hypothetical protein